MKTSFLKIAFTIALPAILLIACEKNGHEVEPQTSNTHVSTSNGGRLAEVGEVVFEGELTKEELIEISSDSVTQEQLDIFALIPDGGELSGYKTTEGAFKYAIIEKRDYSNGSRAKTVYCKGKASYGLVKCAVKAIDEHGCVQVTKEGDQYLVSSCQP
jgi:hypothetical protein